MRIKNPNIQSHTTFLIYSLFVASLFLLARGYVFQDGDQAEHLPLVYKSLDPSLYPHDYFVAPASQVFTVRYFFVKLLAWSAVWIRLDVLCFVLTLACLTATSWATMRISVAMSLDRLAPFMSPLFALFVFYGFTIGGNYIQYPTLICSTIAKALAIWGLAAYFEKKWVTMSVLLGIAALFQVLVALQLFLVLWLCMIWLEKEHRWQRAGKSMAWFLVVSAPMLFPILYRQFFQHHSFDRALYYEILYSFRNPLHYLPSLFPLRSYVKLTVLATAALALLYVFRFKAEKKRIFRPVVVIVAGLVLYTLMLENLQWLFIGKLQWYKTTIWLAFLSSLIVAVVVSKAMQLIGQLYIMLAYLRNIVIVGIVLMLLVMVNSQDIPWRAVENRYQVGRYVKGDLTVMHEWIRDHTDKDAVFLYSPDNFRFACEAQRSSLIGYKAIIHEPFFLLPWYEKFAFIYGVDLDRASASTALQEAVMEYRRRYFSPGRMPYDYRIDRLDECRFTDSLGTEVFRSGPYVLTQSASKR